MLKIFNLVEKIKGKLFNFSWQIGVDWGSSNILVYVKDRGVIIDEPTLLARQKKKRWSGLSAPKSQGGRVIAIGYKAKEILSREPRQIEVVAPIKNGIIADLEAAEAMMSHYLKLVGEIPSKKPKFLRPRVIAGVPGSITEVQKRAVGTVMKTAGAGEVTLVEEAILAALGAGLPVDSPAGLMVVDIGGGKSEATVVSLGGIVVGKGIKTGGDDFDQAITNFVRMKYGLLIGSNTAERIKIEIGNLLPKSGEGRSMIVRGRDLESGLPKSIRMAEGEVMEACAMEMAKIIKLIEEVMDETPPELMEDVIKKGIILCGKGAELRGIDKVVERETKISCRVADEPGLAVIKGIGALIEDEVLLSRIKLVLDI